MIGAWLVALTVLSGCERVETPFVESEQTRQLMPAARERVNQSLRETFGSPADPRIPHYFPVNRGGTVVEIASFSPEAASELTVETADSPTIVPGQKLEFLFDPEEAFDVRQEALENEVPDPLAALHGLRVAHYDAESGRLELSQPLPELELIDAGLEVAIEANQNLRRGRQLYDQHCLHCHGVSGDGNGPTAQFMQPRPRDYRLGLFKFTSTGPQEKIATEDLKRILREGIPGTYMPAFNMQSEEVLDRLVEYVKFLSLRGEAEKNLNVEVGVDFSQKVLDDELADVEDESERAEIQKKMEDELQEFLDKDYPEIELGVYLDLAELWARADQPRAVVLPSMARPDPLGPSLVNPELTSIENGRLLYLGKDAQCASCHGDTGKGNGYQSFQFQKKRDGSDYDVIGLHDDWGNPLPIRDLTSGIYRGGRRPLDVYRRIYSGIKGTPMPVFGGKGLTDAQIWDIVNYVLTLSEQRS